MPQFAYKARRRSGELVEGTLEVPDRAAALLQIDRLGLFPINVDAPKGGLSGRPGQKEDAKARMAEFLPPAAREFLLRKRKPKLQELATFTQQLANLLKSGMPLTVALNSMTHLESKGISSDVSKQLKQEVTEGRSLSDAMSRQPHIFTNLYVNMVRAGEQSGALEDVLRRLADHYERFAEVQSKFTSALIYPAFVAGVGTIVIFVFMTKMLPKFMEIFKGLKDVQLPMATQILINLSEIFKNYWWLMLSMLAVGLMLFVRYKATAAGRRTLDQWKLNAPILGKVMRLNLFGQFARTLGTLLQNGVPLLTALKITEDIMNNVILKEAIAKTREAVTDGKTLSQPLAYSKIFPQLMIDLLKIGEETGEVPSALKNISDTYETELNIALRVMTNMIEPIIIVIMAIFVGGLLYSILSAMFAITANIAR